MSQEQEILDALRAGEVLTPQDALRRFHCFRLAARIHDLRGEGWNIRSYQDAGEGWQSYVLRAPEKLTFKPGEGPQGVDTGAAAE